MPELKNINVSVVTDDKASTEYGVQQRKSSNFISCHIESSHGARFHVSITPRLSDDFVNFTDDPNRPFDLLASVCLDGRKTPERRAIVYLDEYHPQFSEDVRMSHRLIATSDGKTVECPWQFKEVGLETHLHRLSIAPGIRNEPDPEPVAEEEELVSRFEGTRLGGGFEGLQNDEQRFGSIVVTLKRITVGEVRTVRNYQPKYYEQDYEIGEVKDGARRLSHVTDVAKGRPMARDMPTISYLPYDDDDEELYAEFRFLYRSADFLRKFNLIPTADGHASSLTPHKRTSIRKAVSHMTPLSISGKRLNSNDYSSSSVSKRSKLSALSGGPSTLRSKSVDSEARNLRDLQYVKEEELSPKTMEDLEDHGQEVEWMVQLQKNGGAKLRSGAPGPRVAEDWDYTTTRDWTVKEKGKGKAARRDSVIEDFGDAAFHMP